MSSQTVSKRATDREESQSNFKNDGNPLQPIGSVGLINVDNLDSRTSNNRSDSSRFQTGSPSARSAKSDISHQSKYSYGRASANVRSEKRPRKKEVKKDKPMTVAQQQLVAI